MTNLDTETVNATSEPLAGNLTMPASIEQNYEDPMANELNCEDLLLRSNMERTVVSIAMYSPTVELNVLDLEVITKTYSMEVEWPDDLAKSAVFSDISEQLNNIDISKIVNPLLGTLDITTHTTIIEDILNSQDALLPSEMEGLNINEVEIRDLVKNAIWHNKKKNRDESRINRIKFIINECNTLRNSIRAQEDLINKYLQPAPVPHGESGQMRLGSDAEIEKAKKYVAETNAKLAAKTENLGKHIDAFNTYAAENTMDSTWTTEVPPLLQELSDLNAKLA